MINNVVLTGRLTQSITLKYSNNGIAIGNFTLAVNRQHKSQDGSTQADFINCLIFKEGANILAKYTKKGSLLGVEGRIQTRNYKNKEGQTVYVTEVLVDKFTFLESKNKDNTTTSRDPFDKIQEDFGSVVHVEDEDLPF